MCMFFMYLVYILCMFYGPVSDNKALLLLLLLLLLLYILYILESG